MGSSLQGVYDDFCRNYWTDKDPTVCACHGSGWAISDVDTVHKCPVHYTNQPHPDDMDWDVDAHVTDPVSPVTVGEPALAPAVTSDFGDDDIPF